MVPTEAVSHYKTVEFYMHVTVKYVFKIVTGFRPMFIILELVKYSKGLFLIFSKALCSGEQISSHIYPEGPMNYLYS